MIRLATCAALALVVVCSVPGLASAQDEDVLDPEAQMEAARQAFREGTEAYEAGLYEEALARFRRAYELTGTPDVLYNIARAADRLDRNEEALDAYDLYLQLRPEAEDREHIEERILSLRALLDSDRAAPPAPRPPPVEATPEPEPVDVEPEPPEAPAAQDPGPAPWILAGGGVAVAAGGTALYLLADATVLSALGLVGAGVGGVMLLGGVVWAVSF